jgi:hypothetical protein
MIVVVVACLAGWSLRCSLHAQHTQHSTLPAQSQHTAQHSTAVLVGWPHHHAAEVMAGDAARGW